MYHRTVLITAGLSSTLLIGFAVADLQASDSFDCESARTFPVNSIYMERNETDRDSEVVVQVKSGDIGMSTFVLISPTEKIIYQLSAAAHSLGAREIEFESPETSDIELVNGAYPEGLYSFYATTVDGQQLCGRHRLTHTLPAPTVIEYPDRDEIVPLTTLTVLWAAVDTATGYTLEVENERTGQELIIQIPVEENTFTIPSEWLQASTEYSLGITVKNQDGNEVEVQSSFFTSGN